MDYHVQSLITGADHAGPRNLSQQEGLRLEVTDTLVRLSVGIEAGGFDC